MNIVRRAGIWPGLAFTALAAGLAGCASHSQQSANTVPTAAEMQVSGAKMQQEGIMSQSDYVKIRGLVSRIAQTHTISDADLDWTVAHLNTQGNSIARARFFNTLADIRPVTPAQKAKILPVITPYLTSTDRLDRLGAARVQKKMQAS